MKLLNYSLTVQITGLKENECADGQKGAGEAKKAFEQAIRGMHFSAASTDLRVKTLEEV